MIFKLVCGPYSKTILKFLLNPSQTNDSLCEIFIIDDGHWTQKSWINCIVNGWYWMVLMHSVAKFPETQVINDEQQSERIIIIIVTIESGWIMKSH